MLCLLSVKRVLLRVNVLLSSSVYCPSLFFYYLFNINVCTVKACRLQAKVLNYVQEEDIMKCNISTGTSVSVCKFVHPLLVCSSLYCHCYGSIEREQWFSKWS